MSLPSLAPELERAGMVRWLSRAEPILAGPSLGEMGLFERGFRDDFTGDLIKDEWEQRISGAGSVIGLVDGAHGGVVRLTAGPAAGRYARLSLGITLGVGPYDTDSLDPDEGFDMIGRWCLSSTALMGADMFALTDPWWRMHITADTAVGPNWYLRTDNNSGIENWVDSGVAIDTAWHVHRLRARANLAQHYMDGILINSTTIKIPTVCLTACIRCFAKGAAARDVDVGYILVIPQ